MRKKERGRKKKTLVNEFRGRSCSKIGTFEKHVVTLDQKKINLAKNVCQLQPAPVKTETRHGTRYF